MPTIHVLNLGAGVQSTALYLMSVLGDDPEFVPAFDCAIFADTQEEPEAVYRHLAWLRSLGGPKIHVATAGKLGDDLKAGRNMSGGRFASIPAYTMTPGAAREGQIRRQCTSEYKIEVIERVIRRQVLGLAPRMHIPRGTHVVQSMGLSFDEPGRIVRVRGRFQSLHWAEPRFPLFDLEMTRQGCLEYLARVAPGRKVARSACVFCPYRSNAEFRLLRDTDPEGWERACVVDESLRAEGAVVNRNLDAKLYIHRSCKPLRLAPIDTPESREEQYTFGFAAECDGMCGV